MKKYLFFLACLFIVSFYACSDDMDDEEEEEMMEEDPCEGTAFTYTNTVKAIIDSNCATSGCHDGGSGPPDFTTYAGISGKAGGAVSRTMAGTMPPPGSGKSLTEAQIEVISCWAASGAPE